MSRDSGGSDPTHVLPAPGPNAVSFHLEERNDSQQTGAVTLDPRPGGRTRIGVVLTAPTGAKQPVQIHRGTCNDPGQIVQRLNPLRVTDDSEVGRSTTTIDVRLARVGRRLAIDAHESPWDPTVVACSDLPGRDGLIPDAEAFGVRHPGKGSDECHRKVSVS